RNVTPERGQKILNGGNAADRSKPIPGFDPPNPPAADEDDIPRSEPTITHPDPAPIEPEQRGSIIFLGKLRPGGPWLLIAIDPDSGAILDKTVRSPKAAAAFVDKWNGKRNLYYSVNPTRTELDKKAAKTDIAAIEYALADLDPNEGETSEAAKARYLQQLNGGSFKPRPTMALDSGNGIHFLWRLADPIEHTEPI